ncbi:hypothetical protein LWF15_01910 [Kineosporia rhizophila]|uniref:hypothetical protein n=1 Tax=Kineosporia TaxID=49184 RepID=UPI000A90A743|nr:MULTISPECIES: hypothetical protein [Kineosporia]MCE0534254.1 hypothetical protein [Kineosporia rhizophila]GLY13802.1 hypothetical protein Kisp01_08180 [Kineosporia sp. NBRC 101677]
MALRKLLITLTATALLAGCGGDSTASGDAPSSTALSNTLQVVPYDGLQPVEIYKLVRTSVRKADSVRVRMESENAGAVLSTDLRLDRDGSATGSVSPTDDQQVELLKVGDDAWFKGDQDFLDAYGVKGAQPEGEWRAITAKSPVAGFLTYTEIPFYTDTLLKLSRSEMSGLRQVDGQEFDGRLAIGLQTEDEALTLYASADGEAELVGYRSDEITYTFSDWDEPVGAEAPGTDG